MTISHPQTGAIQRQIPLIRYTSLDDLRRLMEDQLGFVQKRTPQEYERYKQRQSKRQKLLDRENEQRVHDEQLKLKLKKDEIADRVLKMMERNMQKQQEAKTVERD